MADDVSCLMPDKHVVDGISMPGILTVKHLNNIKNLHLNSTDVIVAGYLKSGMYFLQNIIFPIKTEFCYIS